MVFSETNRSGAGDAGIIQLMQLHNSMDEYDGLRVKNANYTRLYKEAGAAQKRTSEVGFFLGRSYDGAKAIVHDVVSERVGKSKAREIMKKVLGKNWRGRFWYSNKKAMTKTQLGSAIDETLRAMSNEDRCDLRTRLAVRSDSDSAKFIRDPKIRKMVHHYARREFCEENVDFIVDCHDLEAEVQKFDELASQKGIVITDDGQYLNRETMQPVNFSVISELNRKLAEIRKKASQIHSQFIQTNAKREINIDHKMRKRLEQEARNISTLGPRQLKAMLVEPKNECARLLKSGSCMRFEDCLSNDKKQTKTQRDPKTGNITVEATRTPLGVLKVVSKTLDPNDHLRQVGDILYAKSNSAGFLSLNHARKWGSRKRGKKFDTAKQTVLKVLTQHLDNDKNLAERIMQPLLDSDRALSKSNLEDIIRVAERWENMKQEIRGKVDLNGPPTTDAVAEFAERPEPWSRNFSQYCAFFGKEPVWEELRDLTELDKYFGDLSRGAKEVTKENKQKAIHAATRMLERVGGAIKPYLKQFAANGELKDTKTLHALVKARRVAKQAELAPTYTLYWATAHNERQRVNARRKRIINKNIQLNADANQQPLITSQQFAEIRQGHLAKVVLKKNECLSPLKALQAAVAKQATDWRAPARGAIASTKRCLTLIDSLSKPDRRYRAISPSFLGKIAYSANRAIKKLEEAKDRGMDTNLADQQIKALAALRGQVLGMQAAVARTKLSDVDGATKLNEIQLSSNLKKRSDNLHEIANQQLAQLDDLVLQPQHAGDLLAQPVVREAFSNASVSYQSLKKAMADLNTKTKEENVNDRLKLIANAHHAAANFRTDLAKIMDNLEAEKRAAIRKTLALGATLDELRDFVVASPIFAMQRRNKLEPVVV